MGEGQEGQGGRTTRKKYVLDEESTSTRARVDDAVLERDGEAVELTVDQHERLSAVDGIKLRDAS